jgi:hypothetical protein
MNNKSSTSPCKSSKTHIYSAYKTLARPILTRGSEARIIRKQDEQRLATAEMKFMRRITGYSLLDHIRNKSILDKIKVTPITEYANSYKQN